MAINQLLQIQNAPQLNVVMSMNADADLYEVCRVICGGVVRWIVIQGEQIAFSTKELTTSMKVWLHFICARLIPTAHHTKVTHERALFLYAIAKNLSINVGQWIVGNIKHLAQNVSLGILHPTLLTELFFANGMDTTREEILQPKGPLNCKALEPIVKTEGKGSDGGASSSRGGGGGAGSSQLAKLA